MRALFIMTLLVVSSAAVAQNGPGPTVGDPITITLDLAEGEHVSLDSAGEVDLIQQEGGRVTVRGFRPGTHVLRFLVTDESGSTRELTSAIEITSVLHEDDDLEPAPLAPPVPLSPNRVAWIANGVAAAAAAAVWLYLLWMPRARRSGTIRTTSAADELMQAIERVRRMSPSDDRFATLSDAARQFLSRVDPRFGRALTTTELIALLGTQLPERLVGEVRDVLSEGDYAKFSPWGGRAARFHLVVEEAADLVALDRERGPQR